MKLTDHFTLEELVFSQTATRKGIDNTPSGEQIANLGRLAQSLEAVRKILDGSPIIVSSGYRSPALNRAVGGSAKSYHMRGLAVDFTAPAFGNVLQVARHVVASDLPFDQVIYEYGDWVHLGIPEPGDPPRLQVLSTFTPGKYLAGLVNETSDVA